ncbi:MAG: ketol-acid reductoisomerase [Burkholderiales bacterium]|nr:ketol-acid reductoisomerase [Anaerolineae bacterium]
MTIVYHEEDGDLEHLADKKIAVIGYGNLGRPAALNLRDSGINVLIGARAVDTSVHAASDGFRVISVAEAAQQAQIIMLLIPDEVMPQVYLEQVAPYLSRGDTLIFGNAYNITFGFIEPPPFVDVGLIAPRTLGDAVRARHEAGRGFYSFVAVGQDASGGAWKTVLALARGVGSLRAGAIEIAFEQEAHLDLFIQQAVLPAFHHMVITAARLLMSKGYPPEAVLTELYIGGEFTDYLSRAAQDGLLHALQLGSMTSQYGTFSRLDRFGDLKLERLMEVTLEEITTGAFAREWAKEYSDGYPRLDKLRKSQSDMEVWELEQQTLDMLMPFREEGGYDNNSQFAPNRDDETAFDFDNDDDDSRFAPPKRGDDH